MDKIPQAEQFGAIILCRYDSSRLPGKALREVNNLPILWYVIARCKRAQCLHGQIIVATSDRQVDDPIAQYCEKEKIEVFRGSVEDVSGRTLRCAQTHGWKYFFRVNGDSPFVDASLLDTASKISTHGSFDIITNLHPRSFPYGVSVELINTESYNEVYRLMYSPDHFEHVTKYIYEHIQSLCYYNISRNGEDLSHIHMTIDTEQDFRTFSAFIHQSRQEWQSVRFEDALEFYQQLQS